MNAPRLETVEVRLWLEDAIVLFDWLMTVDLNCLPSTHPAEKQALADLLNRLEQDTDAPGADQDRIDKARQAVAENMGW